MKSLCCRRGSSLLHCLPPLLCRCLSSQPLLSSQIFSFSTRLSSYNRTSQLAVHTAVSNTALPTMSVDQKQQPAPYTVFIEGNVGSGKTTFLEQFSDCPNVFMAKEPVHKWQDVHGHNFLVSRTVEALLLC